MSSLACICCNYMNGFYRVKWVEEKMAMYNFVVIGTTRLCCWFPSLYFPFLSLSFLSCLCLLPFLSWLKKKLLDQLFSFLPSFLPSSYFFLLPTSSFFLLLLIFLFLGQSVIKWRTIVVTMLCDCDRELFPDCLPWILRLKT